MTTTPDESIQNPYVGPRTFGYQDRKLFFGREREARDLLARVVSERTLLFYAQSGAGKSSLLQARLIPHLREEEGFAVLPVGRVSGELPAGIPSAPNLYLFNLMTNLARNAAPFALSQLTLTDFLAHLVSEDGETWVYDPAATSDGGQDATAPGQRYALIIDQFEEIITTHPGRWREREDFFRQLNQALLADPNLWVVLTLREDYVAALDPYAQLMADKLRARFYMERMQIDAALEAVRRPAEIGQRPFAPGVAEALVDNLRQLRLQGQSAAEATQVDDGGAKPAALGQYIEPVQLQVVCYQLWENLRKQTKSLNVQTGSLDQDLSDFENLTGLPEAADQAGLPQISAADLQQAGNVDEALTQFYNDALANALREAPLKIPERRLRTWFDDELITAAGTRGTVFQGMTDTAGLPNVIVKALQDQFLLRVEQRAGGYWVELVHDRFIEPIRQANARWRTQYQNPVADAYQRWQTGGQRDELLLTGYELREVQIFAEQRQAELTEDEQEFLQRCLVTAKRQQEEGERLAQNRRRSRIIIGAVIAALILAVLAGVTTLSAIRTGQALKDTELARATAAQARDEANRKAQEAAAARVAADRAREEALVLARKAAIARANQLAQAAVSAYDEESLLLAVEAVTTTWALSDASGALRVPSAEQSLRTTLQQTRSQPRLPHDGQVYDVAFSPDERLLASAGSDGVIRLWQMDDLTAPPLVLTGHEGTVFDVAFSPNGKLLASAGADRTVRVWSIGAATTTATVLRGHTAGVARVSFSPDGRWLASASSDKTVRLWSVGNLQTESVALLGHTDKLYDIVFSPNSQWLASASQDKTIRLWQVGASQLISSQPLMGHTDGVVAITFSPDGRWLASAGLDHSVRLWALDDLTTQLILPNGAEAVVRTVDFSPNGDWLAAASDDMNARLWKLDDLQAEPIVLSGLEQKPFDASFSPDGRWFAAGGESGRVVLWAMNNLQADPIAVDGQQGTILSLAFSSADPWLASASFDGSIQLWPLDMAQMVRLACQKAKRNLKDEEWVHYFGEESYHSTCPMWPIHPSLPQAAYAKGKALAQLGRLSAAVVQFRQALALDPTLKIDPTGEAQRIQRETKANALVTQATGLASEGDVSAASVKFAEALTLNPTLNIMPEAAAQNIYTETQQRKALELVDEGRTLVLQPQPDVASAIEKFTQALNLYPSLTLEPQQEAQRLAAQTYATTGRQQAQAGNLQAARTAFAKAEGVDLATAINPDVEVQLEYGRGLASRGAYAQAMDAFAKAQTISPTLEVGARLFPEEWQRICKQGAHNGLAAVVLPACDHAIALQPENGALYENRGFARALLNDTAGAIADLQVYTSWATPSSTTSSNQSQMAPISQSAEEEATVAGRKAWIAALQAGINPPQAFLWARTGKIDAAIEVYAAFRALDPPLQLTAEEWNNLCWFGSLADRVERVFYACEWAVLLAPENGNFHDSRGLARALTGDLPGAIADFEFYLANSGGTLPPATLQLRRSWVAVLYANLNPVAAYIAVRNGEVDEALAIYHTIRAATPPLELAGDEWNNLCWYGALAGRARDVLFACDLAVKQEPSNGNFHDSRGVARTLLGDLAGAIQDFQVAVQWANKGNEGEHFLFDRRLWLYALQLIQGNGRPRALFVKPFAGDYPITQAFGDNPEIYSRISYDGVPLRGHNGIDYALPLGTEVLASDDGVVKRVDIEAAGLGNYILIEHVWGESLYAQLDQVAVTQGQAVKRGEVIGLSGQSGMANGPFLHFAIRLNPYERTDGWGGFSDPEPYLGLR